MKRTDIKVGEIYAVNHPSYHASRAKASWEARYGNGTLLCRAEVVAIDAPLGLGKGGIKVRYLDSIKIHGIPTTDVKRTFASGAGVWGLWADYEVAKRADEVRRDVAERKRQQTKVESTATAASLNERQVALGFVDDRGEPLFNVIVDSHSGRLYLSKPMIEDVEKLVERAEELAISCDRGPS